MQYESGTETLQIEIESGNNVANSSWALTHTQIFSALNSAVHIHLHWKQVLAKTGQIAKF